MEWIQNVYYKYCDRSRFFNSFTWVPSLDGQHQIRYHKTALKTPISIDDLYSKFKHSNDVCRFVSDDEHRKNLKNFFAVNRFSYFLMFKSCWSAESVKDNALHRNALWAITWQPSNLFHFVSKFSMENAHFLYKILDRVL